MKQWLIDTGERVLRTFLQTFISVMVASGTDWFNLSAVRGAAIAGGAAVLVVLSSALAALKNGTISPASLVADDGVYAERSAGD